MKNRLLLPAFFRPVGALVLLAGLILFVAWSRDFTFAFLDTGVRPEGISGIFQDNNLTNELAGMLLLSGLLMLAFSRVRQEDERTTLLRLQSLQLSHYLSYLVFAITLFAVNGLPFLLVLLYLPYAFLGIFILVFYGRMYLLPKFAAHEE